MCSLEKSESDQQNNENMEDGCPSPSTQSSDSCSENEKIYACHICNQTYAMDRERQECIERGFKICRQCNKKFKPETYHQHMMLDHMKVPYKCHYCEKAFCWKKHLRDHLKMHKSEDYICNKCNKRFRKESDLCRHYDHVFEESVLRKKRIKALIREKYEEYLKQYKKNDKRNKCDINGESPYKCDHCTGTFRWKYDLQQHKKVHDDTDDTDDTDD